ncbi:HEAT repeat domain-containing protein [Candidatus Uabimicrobium sp. HlEnr_7]|uniref:HEAT repeat domain-containing protein n=1 Tax=Candidatus Uabimicrobium helgolandensis TaxID=3095367 RepID=UPI0035580A4B
MIVFLCDQCQKIISEAELRNGSTRKKNGEVVCGECSTTQKNSRELFSCDRCNKKHSLDLLRTGKATLVKGKLYCHRCREFAEKKSREILDFKYLSAVFILFLGIPMMIGSSMWLYHYMQNASDSLGTSQQNNTKQEISILREEMQKIIKSLQQPQNSNNVENRVDNPQENATDKTVNNTSNNDTPKKSLDEILNDLNKKNPPIKPRRGVEPNSIKEKVAEIKLKVQNGFAQKLKNSDESVRIEAILQIMQTRERSCIDLLIDSLKDKSALVRSFAAKALGTLGANKSIPQLLSSVSDKSPQVRRSIARSLTMLTGRGFKDHQDLSEQDKQKLIDFINRER